MERWDYPYYPEKNKVIFSSAPAKIQSQVTHITQQVENPNSPFRQQQQVAIDNATGWITGTDGGYVVIHRNEQGQPDEILIMDKPDIATATKVWRWNSGGLGYSSNGYNGPYNTAITQDGSIVADFITAGTLNAAEVNIINLIANHLTSNSGNYTLEAWAAALTIMEQTNMRVRIYTTGTDAPIGIVQVFSGTHPSDGEGLDETSRYSFLTPTSIGAGQTKDGNYVGVLYIKDIQAGGTITAAGDISSQTGLNAPYFNGHQVDWRIVSTPDGGTEHALCMV